MDKINFFILKKEMCYFMHYVWNNNNKIQFDIVNNTKKYFNNNFFLKKNLIISIFI